MSSPQHPKAASIAHYYLPDPATVSFRPWMDLLDSTTANLTSRAVPHWLSQSAPEDWGAAMMPGSGVRAAFHAGGVEAPPFETLQSSHPKWLRLQTGLASGTLSADEQLYFARLLLYLGLNEAALDLLAPDTPLDAAQVLGRAHLRALAVPAAARAPELRAVEAAFGQVPAPTAGTFRAALLLAGQARKDMEPTRAAHWLHEAERHAAQAGAIAGVAESARLARARLERHRAAFALASGDVAGYRRSVAAAFEALGAPRPVGGVEGWDYLFEETRRRLLDFVSEEDGARGDHASAFEHARRAAELDPACPVALRKAGESAEQVGQRERARHFLHAAALVDVPGRAQVLRRLAELGERPTLVQAYQEEAAQSVLAPAPTRPGRSDVERAYEDALQQSPVFQRLRPFWDLSDPAPGAPIFTHNPVIAWRAVVEPPELGGATAFLQRVMVSTFRKELFYASVAGRAPAQRHVAFGTSLEALRGRSARADQLLERVAHVEDLPKLERAYVSRLLLALGFPEEALDMLEPPSLEVPWDSVDQHLAVVVLFTENVLTVDSRANRDTKYEAVFQKLEREGAPARRRLLLAMAAAVHTGQLGDVARCGLWRERGIGLLRAFEAAPSTSAFELGLLTSRLYRGISYHPFLTGDLKTLREDVAICERTAREMKPSTELERLLKAENLYPMLESMARIATRLGEPDRARALMEEIVSDVDPVDSKAWIQVGELRERAGELSAAADAFVTAGRLAVPAGRVAWFKAGQVFEKLDQPLEAQHCYLQSLRLWPNGLAPVQRLRALARKAHHRALQQWAEDALRGLNATGALPQPLGEQIAALLGTVDKPLPVAHVA